MSPDATVGQSAFVSLIPMAPCRACRMPRQELRRRAELQITGSRGWERPTRSNRHGSRSAAPLLSQPRFGRLRETLMDAARSSPPARGEERPGIARGVIVALLLEVHADRIVVGDRTFLLRDGKTCTYTPGTNLEVLYTEQNERAVAESITALKPTR